MKCKMHIDEASEVSDEVFNYILDKIKGIENPPLMNMIQTKRNDKTWKYYQLRKKKNKLSQFAKYIRDKYKKIIIKLGKL